MSNINELRLSVSKCKTYESCQKKFNYTYNLKLPRKTQDYHILGKFCHKVLEDFHNIYIKGSKEAYNITMSSVYKNVLKEYGESMTKDMKAECYKMIGDYLKLISSSTEEYTVTACEKDFNFLIRENVSLIGSIDRVQNDADGVLHICDYKTTKNKKYLKDDWFQLMAYAYFMLTFERPNDQKVRCSYILLRHNFEYVTKEFTREEILPVIDKFNKYADDIIAEEEYKPTVTPLCLYCDFIDVCPEGQTLKQKSNKYYGEISW